MEMCSISVDLNGNRIKIIGVYRPPNGCVRVFADDLNNILSTHNTKEKIFLVGDLNVDLLDPTVTENEFINVCVANSFLPLITGPTRLSRDSASCIDHIWYNQIDDAVSGILKLDISDHFAVFTSIILQIPNSEFILKRFRDHSENCVQLLRTRVSAFVADFNMSGNPDCDVNAATVEFCDRLYEIYDNCCPLRSKTVSVDRMSKPWITRELINCVNRKHHLFRLYKRGEVAFAVYNSFKNVLTSLIRRAKSNYFVSKFNSKIGDARETWKYVGRLFNRRITGGTVDEVICNGVKTGDRQNIADIFNRYFSNIGAQLDQNIAPARNSPLDYMGISSPNSIFVQPSVPSEIASIILKLQTKPSNLKTVPVYIFKQIVDLISPVISFLFNGSISVGIFPDCLKVARVVPIHKSGDKCVPSNYRPISVLPLLSKIFEKIMFSKIMFFLKANKLLHNHQFGFRENSSTSDAVSQFLDFVFESVSGKSSVLAIFLDFSKAFDTVNHKILCAKLHHIGFRGIVLKWFESYLADRKQYVEVGGASSSLSNVNMGVPQGSVLGPVLFLIYINDMCKASVKLNFIHFADDTTVFHSHDNIDTLAREVNGELNQLNAWLITNRLSLNVSKTSFMIFSDKKIIHDPVVCISDKVLHRVVKSKFLGIFLDENLSFGPHIDYLCKQVSQAVGMLNRLSSVMPHAVRVLVYFSLIYSRLTYGIIVWGFGSVTRLSKLERIVGKAHGTVNRGVRDGVRCRKLFTVSSAHKYFTAVKFFKSVKLDHHQHFTAIFDSLRPSHNHDTRFGALNYNIPHYSKTKCNRSFQYQAINIWNSLSDDLKRCDSLDSFKGRLKVELLERQQP